MAILKQCSWHGCTKIVADGISYCDYHANKYDKKQKERYKEYSNRRRLDAEQKKYQDFYSSDDWKRVRQAVISDYLGMDILEYYRTGRIVEGERIHHIIELSEDFNCRLDVGNLIYLTEQNHRRVHVEYDKSDKDKEKMQKMLFELLDKFYKEFK
jgi:5-methylcytosine-specific restriction endonuclease McrA